MGLQQLHLRPGHRGLSIALVALALVGPTAPARAQEEPAGKPAGDAPVVVPDDAGPEVFKRLTLEQLMSLEVTSVSRRPEKLSEVASAIQVISGEEVRRSGASTLPEAMRLADNLQVAQKNAHDWAISARGFNTALSNKLLVLVDGRTVYTPLFSGVFWNAQHVFLPDLDRIEVISGPGGSVWGANAVNGVINVISKSAGETQGLFVEGGLGNQLNGSGAVRYGGTLGENAHYRVYGTHADFDAERLASGASAGDAWHRSTGGFRIDGRAGADDGWTFQGDVYSGHDGIVTGGEALVEGGNVLGRWTHAFAGSSELIAQAYADWTRLRLPVPALRFGELELAPAGTAEDRLDTYDLDLQHSLRPHGRHLVIWGAGVRLWEDRVESAPALGFVPEEVTHRLWSAFVQDEVEVGDRTRVTLGTKVEHNDNTGWELEPSLRFHFDVSAGHLLWAAASRAVRTPSRIDLALSQPAPPSPLVILAGNPELDSETVVALEVGWRGELGDRATLSAAGFYNDYEDLRSTRTTPGTVFPLVFDNEVEGETWGLELSSRLRLGERWHFHGGYTLLQEDLRVEPGGEDINAALNEVADPQQQLALRASVDLPTSMALDAALRWVDTLHINSGPVIGRVPSYTELDLRLAWRPRPALELSVTGENLLDEAHPEYGFPEPNRVEIQRSVVGRLTWRP